MIIQYSTLGVCIAKEESIKLYDYYKIYEK